MNRYEAIGLALDFIRKCDVGAFIPTANLTVFISAAKQPDLYKSDTWIVHFPKVLPEGVLFMEPDTIAARVDTLTKKVEICKLL